MGLATIFGILTCGVLAQNPEGVLASADPASAAANASERDKLIAQRDDLEHEGNLAEAIQVGGQILARDLETRSEAPDDLASSLDWQSRAEALQGNFRKSRRLARQLVELQVEQHGQDHWQTRDAQVALAGVKQLQNLTEVQRTSVAEALSKIKTSLWMADGDAGTPVRELVAAKDTLRKLVGVRSGDHILALFSLAEVYHSREEYKESRRCLSRAGKLVPSVYGDQHPMHAAAMMGLATYAYAADETDKADEFARTALQICRVTVERGDEVYVESLQLLLALGASEVESLAERGEYAECLPTADELLEFADELYGAQHWRYKELENRRAFVQRLVEMTPQEIRKWRETEKLVAEVLRLAELGADPSGNVEVQPEEAIPLLGTALQNVIELFGVQSQEVAKKAYALGILSDAQEKFLLAELYFDQAAKLALQLLGPSHPDYATYLGHLGAVRANTRTKREEAIQQLRQAVEIHRVVSDETDAYASEYAMCLHSLGRFLTHTEFAEAESSLLKAVEILAKTNDPTELFVLKDLGFLYQMHNAPQAIPIYSDLLPRARQTLGEQHPTVADTLHDLALVLERVGDRERSVELLREALEIREKIPSQRLYYAYTLHNLANREAREGNLEIAEKMAKRALKIKKEVGGERHSSVGTSLGLLAQLYTEQGRTEDAERCFRESLALARDSTWFQPVASSLAALNLAYNLLDQNKLQESEQLMLEATKIAAEQFGKAHFAYGIMLSQLGKYYYSRGDVEKALPSFRQAISLARSHLELLSSVESRRQQLLHRSRFQYFLDEYLQVARHANLSPDTVCDYVLAWKGSVFARQLRQRVLAEDEELAPQLKELDRTNRRLSALLLNPSGTSRSREEWRQEVGELSDAQERLERELTSTSASFRRGQAVSQAGHKEVCRALPAGTVLLDFVQYDYERPNSLGDEKAVSQPWLTAFVSCRGTPVRQLDFGPLKPIDELAKQWKQQLRSDDQRNIGRELRELLWAPLESHLAGADTVLISPDGILADFPWAALPGRRPESYLIEDVSIATIAAPQLLPELLCQDAVPAGRSLLVGGVDYGKLSDEPSTTGTALGRPRKPQLRALPGTKLEIEDIARIWQQAGVGTEASVLQGEEVTEANVRRQLGSCSHLHFATHGFYISSYAGAGSIATHRGLTSLPLDSKVRAQVRWQPHAFATIALAGANRLSPDAENDGMLTALELASLDLRGVDLVVLSACQTGLGEQVDGEGMLSLQRAFRNSGARTTIATLWSVDDSATRAFMVEFYRNLLQKRQSKLTALRQAQLAMLKRYDRTKSELRGLAQVDDAKGDPVAPYYWAGFVLSGDWR